MFSRLIEILCSCQPVTFSQFVVRATMGQWVGKRGPPPLPPPSIPTIPPVPLNIYLVQYQANEHFSFREAVILFLFVLLLFAQYGGRIQTRAHCLLLITSVDCWF